MDFSSLVLMEVDKENRFVKEIGSYEVSEGAEYITKLNYNGESISLFFDTKDDVEEWEYSAIFDNFNLQAFEDKEFNIEEIDTEYNPTWRLQFSYIEDNYELKEKINLACELIKENMEQVMESIKGREEEYK